MQIGITLEPVNIGDPEYPYFAMVFAKNKEKYDILKLTLENGHSMYLVPLYQVVDEISAVKSNYTIRDGKKYCSNCWRGGYD